MIKIIDNILTLEECNELINQAEKKLVTANVLGENRKGYRTAHNCWLFENTDLIIKIKNIIKLETNLEIDNQEKIHIVKYDVGGEYKEHHDFFHPNTDYYDNVIKIAGQRIYSCLFYLNDDFNGGETDFPIKKIKVTPKVGRLLIWKNVKDDSSLDYDSLHSGLPIISGTKWIAIIWVRENKYM